MPQYELPMTDVQLAKITPDATLAIDEFLRGQGFAVTGVTPRMRPNPALVINADRDPSALIAAWTPRPSTKRDRVDKAATYLDAFTDKVTASEALTLADVAKAVSALYVIVRQRTAGMDT